MESSCLSVCYCEFGVIMLTRDDLISVVVIMLRYKWREKSWSVQPCAVNEEQKREQYTKKSKVVVWVYVIVKFM